MNKCPRQVTTDWRSCCDVEVQRKPTSAGRPGPPTWRKCPVEALIRTPRGLGTVAVAMRIVCIFAFLACADGSRAQPALPWPPVTILLREQDAGCEIEAVIEEQVQITERKAKEITDEKAKAIDEQAGIAKEAGEHRDKGEVSRFETGMRRTEFSMHVPEVTIRYQKTRIPTVHITYATTKVRLIGPGQCSIGSTDVPEFRDFRMTMRTHDILIPCLKEFDAVLSLPQFKAGETEIRVPQLTVSYHLRTLSFHLPQVTVRDWEVDQKRAEGKIAAEEDLLKRHLEELKRDGKARTAEAVRVKLKELYEKVVAELDANSRETVSWIDTELRTLRKARQDAYEAATKAGGSWTGTDSLMEIDGSLEGYRRRLLEAVDSQRGELNGIFNDLVARYLGPVIAAKGAEAFCTKPTYKPVTGGENIDEILTKKQR
jgi:hypothetical protein